MKKLLSIMLAVTTIVWLAGSYVPVAKAAIVDGDIVSATTSFSDADGNTYQAYDVFIVKIVGSKIFKRLILNPEVFTSYGHLKWSNLKKLSAATVASYTTSALVRVINEQPVYVLAPNGDTGTKQWVDDIACFNSHSYDWDSVYIINATDGNNYSTIGSLCGTGGIVGNMTLSLASDNPAATTIPPNAQGVTFLKVNVAGSGTLNQVTISRHGAGAIADFGDLYIYKDGVRMTSGRSLSSSNSKVTFINLGIAAPATFEVVANVSGTAGDVDYLSIDSASDITANATIGGVFPINGNPMGFSGTSAGTLTVARSGAATSNVTIGATGVEISQFKVTTTSEAGNIYRIRLFNGGTAENDKVTNLKLKDNAGTLVATSSGVSAGGYADFVFSTPYYIKKGESQIFRVYADIGATKPDRTIILYMELASDILAKGSVYGFGMAAIISSFDATGDGVTVTCKGGDLTINKLGPSAANIGTTTSDTDFLDFTMSAAADITIKRTRLMYCEDLAGDGAFDTYASSTYGASDALEDIKIVDKDSGVVIAGPKDGTAFNDNVQTNACETGISAIYEDFTDTIDLTAGTTKTYKITADVKTSNTGTARNIASGSKLKFILYSYATLVSTGNVNYMKYANTNDAVVNTAIAPSGDIAGETMTVQTSSLAVALAASPSGASSAGTSKTYVKGQSGVEAVGIVFTAGSASNATVNSITLTAYTSEDAGTSKTFAAGMDTNYVKDSIGNVYIYDKTTGALVPGSTAKGFSGSNSSLVVYTGLNWVIPAGESRTLLVKADISSASPASASTADTWISFSIADPSTEVSAIDADGNSITLAATAPNGTTSPTTDFGIAKYGSFTVVAASDTPDKAIVVMGTNDNEVSKFKLTAANEGWLLEKFSVSLIDGDVSNYYPDAANAHSENFSAIKLKYQTQSQWGTSNWTISDGKTFSNTATLSFSFSGDNRIYVPKDDSTYVTALASIAGYNGGQGAISKVPFRISTISGSDTTFKAYGAQSGQLLTDFTEPSASGFNLQFVARSKPVFAKVASTATNELARFSITAVGYDVIFDGTADSAADQASNIASACLRFDVVASTTDTASINLYLYDWNENILASKEAWAADGDSNILDGTVTSVSFAFSMKDVTIPSGTTKEMHVDLAAGDSGDFSKTDEYIYLQLKNSNGGNLATGSMAYGQRDIVWGDGTNEEGISGQGDPESRFGMPALIKNIGPLPITFSVIRGTTTP